MPLKLSALKDAPRLLIEVPLKPVQGSRFQPTGFPDLGAATFTGIRHVDGEPVEVESLLVESAPSMANHMEGVCWDEATESLAAPLIGIPYVQSTLPDGTKTNSILEAHRLNSPYIVKSREFESIKKEIGFEANKPFNRRKLSAALVRFDPCSLLHGVFLEKVGGVVRLSRALSAFVEAEGVAVAAAGGVKVDRIQPGTSDENTPYGKAKDGYGNVPFHRDEYTAKKITAYFNIDLAQIRGYGLGAKVEELLVALSLFKIRKFLSTGLRLRTACDLEQVDGVIVKRPDGFKLPELVQLEKEMPALIKAAESSFANPAVTEVTYKK